jgi:hypothetical protein
MRVLLMVVVSAGRLVGPTLVSFVLAATFSVRMSAADEVLVISSQVLEYYEDTYLRNKRPGAMAVSADGLYVGYSYCPDYRCRLNPSARDLAMRSCTKAGGRQGRVQAEIWRVRLFEGDQPVRHRREDGHGGKGPRAGTRAMQLRRLRNRRRVRASCLRGLWDRYRWRGPREREHRIRRKEGALGEVLDPARRLLRD